MELSIHKHKPIWKLVFICLKCFEVKYFSMYNLELTFFPPVRDTFGIMSWA